MAKQVTQASLPQSSGPGPALLVAQFLVSLPCDPAPLWAAGTWLLDPTHPSPCSAPRHPRELLAFIYFQHWDLTRGPWPRDTGEWEERRMCFWEKNIQYYRTVPGWS